LLLFIPGLVLLIGGAELLVRGASRLAVAMGISPLVVGLTVVAYGTSAPELAVSIQSSFVGQANLALGNVVGSNVANVLFILGLSALISPLAVSWQLIRFDVPLMIGISVVLLLLGIDGVIGRLDGSMLFAGAVIYTTWLIYQSRKETRQAQEEAQDYTGPPAPLSPMNVLTYLGLIVGGLGLLVLGSRWLVDSAVTFARMFGISELIIGLTIVAVGTSLPEVATSIMASLRGQRDIAVGNVVGSNIFNILSVIGLASIVAPAGIAVPAAALHFDIPVMIGVAVACLPIFFTGQVIARWEGGLFLGYYVAYLIYLVLRDTGHSILPLFSSAMLFFVLPLTVVTLVVLTIRAVNLQRGDAATG
jgi:cation:H+ antiporter